MDEKCITGIARLDEVIARIAGAVVADGLCEAVLLKGSIARGDADEFSDIDLYLVVSPQNRDAVLERREKYLAAYGDIVFIEDVVFGLPQKVAIFSSALHVDLYVAEPQQVGRRTRSSAGTSRLRSIALLRRARPTVAGIMPGPPRS